MEGSFWEQRSKEDGVQVLGSLKATFTRSPVAEALLAEEILEQAKKDMQEHIPAYEQETRAGREGQPFLVGEEGFPVWLRSRCWPSRVLTMLTYRDVRMGAGDRGGLQH